MDDSEPPEEMAAHLAAKQRRKLEDLLRELNDVIQAMLEALS